MFKARVKQNCKATTQEFVAIKKIKQEQEKEGFPITALREIMLLKKLKHKNIVNLIEVVTTKSMY